MALLELECESVLGTIFQILQPVTSSASCPHEGTW